MASIRYISTSTIRAANHKNNEPTQKVELTPWDLQLLLVGPIQKGLFFFKPKSSSQEITLMHIQQLKTSLSRTLDYFGPLAGRLATIEHSNGGGKDTSFYVDCNNAGALFVHAAADGLTVADIIEPVYVPSNIVHSFFPLNGTRNVNGISIPLLAVQVTELENGIFIGCTMNHAVGDGTSFWHFLNSWSEISRGSAELSKPPVHKRYFLEAPDSPILIPGLTNKEEFCESFNPPPLKERIFHFTKREIAQLKTAANAENGTTNKISSLQALLSHLWRCVVRSRSLDPDHETHFRLLVGARPRLNPPLPEGYFGNAIQAATVTLKGRELLDDGLGHTAWQMNKVVASSTEEKFKNCFKDWIENPKLITMGKITDNALITSSSPRFNMYGNDFGWGKPVAVRSGSGNKHDGKITLFPGVDEGSIDIEVCLLEDSLEALGNDPDFMSSCPFN